MTTRRPRFLLFGFGNPGRLDDGLGPALAASLEAEAPGRFSLEADYQLAVEDAALVAEHDVVIFADAAIAGRAPFDLRRVAPRATPSFSTHSVDPATVLGLAHQLYSARTRGYLLAIRGYCFDAFGEELSAAARANLAASRAFVLDILQRSDVGALEALSEAGAAGGAAAIG